MDKRNEFMLEAIKVGIEGMRNNAGGPFGCVVVKDGKIIGKGCNSVLSHKDPTAHAEVVAIRNACDHLKDFQLTGCEVYTSCEPCPMCLGALYWARPSKIYFANSRKDAAAAGFDDSFIYDEIALPIEQRSLHIECMHMPEAISMFNEWKETDKKTLY